MRCARGLGSDVVLMAAQQVRCNLRLSKTLRRNFIAFRKVGDTCRKSSQVLSIEMIRHSHQVRVNTHFTRSVLFPKAAGHHAKGFLFIQPTVGYAEEYLRG